MSTEDFRYAYHWIARVKSKSGRDHVKEKNCEYMVTMRGKPTALIIPINEGEIEDYILASHPRMVDRREKAREEIEKGEYVSIDELKSLV